MSNQEYCEIIADEVRALEVALDGPAYGWDPSALVDEDSQDQDFRGALDVLGLSHDVDPADVFATYVNESVLEVIQWRADGYAPRVEWLRTYGGPGCRIYFDGNDYARIEVCSLGESDAVVSVYVPTLAACVYEFADA
jgi:hypothetical protein